MKILLPATKNMHLHGATELEDTSSFYATFQMLIVEYTYVVSFNADLAIIIYWNCIKIIRQYCVKRCVKCCVQTTRNDTFFHTDM